MPLLCHDAITPETTYLQYLKVQWKECVLQTSFNIFVFGGCCLNVSCQLPEAVIFTYIFSDENVNLSDVGKLCKHYLVIQLKVLPLSTDSGSDKQQGKNLNATTISPSLRVLLPPFKRHWNHGSLLLLYFKLMSERHFSPPFTYHLTSACFQLLSTYFLSFTIHLQLLAYYYHRLNGAILSPHVTGGKSAFLLPKRQLG